MTNKSQKNNNPLNLRYAKQKEAIGKDDDGFAVFATPQAGWRAAHRQITLDQERDLTLKEFIFKFAPPNENNTNEYLKFVQNSDLYTQFGDPNRIRVRMLNKYALAGVMAAFEGYYA